MTEARARTVAGISFAISALLCVGAAVFLVLAWQVPLRPTEFGVKGYAIAWSLVLAAVGAVIASKRPSNQIGWIFCGLGVISGLLAVSLEYARWALILRGGAPPLGIYSAWLGEWVWIPMLVAIAYVAAVFPDGRHLSPGWRRATRGAVAATAVPVVVNATIPELTVYAGFDNPVAIGTRGLADALGVVNVLMLPILFVGVGALIVRFRRARGQERLQLKWLALAMGLVASMFGMYGVLVLIQGTASPVGGIGSLKVFEYVTIVSFLAVPVSVGFGVLKYRLYDINIVIDKAVVYGAMAVFITGVYLLVVIGVGSLIGYASGPVLSAIAAAIVALAFQPVRHRAQRLANRLVYGERATPYEVLSRFSERLADAYSLEDVLPRMARVVAEGSGASAVTIWLRSAETYRPAATWPPEAGAAPLEPLFEVRHRGELLGAISVTAAPSEPLTPVQAQLIRDVAGQAGLVLRNVRLVEELRASRQRLVRAQDEERRKLERNIHDGVQQQLVALAVQLQLLERQIEQPTAAREEAARLRGGATAALEDLRDLARGIYPPLLADEGLAAALQAQVRKAVLPIVVHSDGIGRFGQGIESAVYFCTLEALTNVAKYARASRAVVRLAQEGGHLVFEVTDDGVGFDPTATSGGTGLQGMSDRIEAAGGVLEILSSPGDGTTVRGQLPIPVEPRRDAPSSVTWGSRPLR